MIIVVVISMIHSGSRSSSSSSGGSSSSRSGMKTADHLERPTITLGWSLARPRGVLEHNICSCSI